MSKKKSSSLTQGWEKMISTSELAAKDRADVFSRINVTIANSLGEQRKVLEGTLKALKNDGDRFTKDLQNMYASESKVLFDYLYSIFKFNFIFKNIKIIAKSKISNQF